jgi:hypothetical protein
MVQTHASSTCSMIWMTINAVGMVCLIVLRNVMTLPLTAHMYINTQFDLPLGSAVEAFQYCWQTLLQLRWSAITRIR